MIYPSKDVLSALPHCIGCDDPDHSDFTCNDCPLYDRCGGENIDYLLSDLNALLLPYVNSDDERILKVILATGRCLSYSDRCNGSCPYWSDCHGENFRFVLSDIYQLLKVYGAYEKED